MKGKKPRSHSQLFEGKKTLKRASISLNHSFNVEEPGDTYTDYIQLSDLPKAGKPRTTGVLNTLMDLGINPEALGQAGGIEPLKAFLTKEQSYSRYFRWAVVDNLVEKILQGLVLNKQDISQKEINFCRGMTRQIPSGRSLLLHQACGLRKMYAARGLALTTEMALTKAVKIFITVSLSYRLYDWVAKGNNDFVEFRALFNNNSEKGVSSLARLLLANFEPTWLYLLLSSPAIVGVLKGLWDTRKSQPLTESAITQLEEAVNYHTNALLKKYLWKDILRQMIPMPGFSSVSERVQKAEQQIRWDGRITDAQRASLFSNIECLALQGRGMSKINAMQSLAKIVHSLSIKDFHQFQDAGYPQETLVQILGIKTQALQDLKMLSNRKGLQTEDVAHNPTTALQQSLVSTLYANYLLWWLGMGALKYSPLFWSFKLGKLALEGFFINGLVKSILDVINCPDKKGFRMFFGDFPLWANQLTLDCFYEFIRQFRTIYKDEPFPPFLEKLSNFDLRTVELIDLSNKALTSNETIQILNILNQRQSIVKILTLNNNKINDTLEFLFPNSLQSLDLKSNNLGDEGAKGLNLPSSLQSLSLWDNNISVEGAKGLNLPPSLQFLGLGSNKLGNEGAKGLNLPTSLQILYLWNNSIGDEGTKGLNLPTSLQELVLSDNHLGDEGAKGLNLPNSLQGLYLESNNISAEGAKGLTLLTSLKFLGLSGNNISAEGAKGLNFLTSLQYLDLSFNHLGDEGTKGLNLPSSLQFLYLGGNNISPEGTKGLNFPTSLTSLYLSTNNLGDEGAKGLKLPTSLQSLYLESNNISAEGAKGLKLPNSLQGLYLGGNNISAEGAKGLNLPRSLQTLYLGGNNISPEGARGLNLPTSLQELDLYDNSINVEGAKGLNLPPSLQFLGLAFNNLGDEGAKELNLPTSLKTLYLWNNSIGDEGAEGLNLPTSLTALYLNANNLGDEGAKRLNLPTSLQYLGLAFNNLGDEGVKALLKKIPKTKLTNIDLSGNPYNFTAISSDRVIQQKRLLENCQSQLCYANTLLSQQNEYQISGATRAEPSLFFSWLKKPFDKLSEYANDCISTTLDSLGHRLEKVLSQSHSYFPNIHSLVINDWQPSGTLVLHQFKAGGSNTLLLSITQTAIQPILGSITR